MLTDLSVFATSLQLSTATTIKYSSEEFSKQSFGCQVVDQLNNLKRSIKQQQQQKLLKKQKFLTEIQKLAIYCILKRYCAFLTMYGMKQDNQGLR